MDRRGFLKRAGASVLAAAIGNNVKRADANKLFYDNTNVKHKNTTMKHKCKITILKRECYKDLQEKYLADPKSGPCPYFREGQVIMVDNDNFFRLQTARSAPKHGIASTAMSTQPCKEVP